MPSQFVITAGIDIGLTSVYLSQPNLEVRHWQVKPLITFIGVVQTDHAETESLLRAIDNSSGLVEESKNSTLGA